MFLSILLLLFSLVFHNKIGQIYIMTGQFCDVIKVAMIHKEDFVKFVNELNMKTKS